MQFRTVFKILRRGAKIGRYWYVPDDHVLYQIVRWARKRATEEQVAALVAYGDRIGGKVCAVARCTIAGAFATRSLHARRTPQTKPARE